MALSAVPRAVSVDVREEVAAVRRLSVRRCGLGLCFVFRFVRDTIKV